MYRDDRVAQRIADPLGSVTGRGDGGPGPDERLGHLEVGAAAVIGERREFLDGQHLEEEELPLGERAEQDGVREAEVPVGPERVTGRRADARAEDGSGDVTPLAG